jgi:hypothetical protein
MEKRVWLSPRALKLHAVILVLVPAFLALCAWQISRAIGGNNLSWAYVFEWPIFAGYAIYMWWRFVHEAADDAMPVAPSDADVDADPGTATAPAVGEGPGIPPDAARPDAARPDAARPDPDLAAYNVYLAQLADRDKASGR